MAQRNPRVSIWAVVSGLIVWEIVVMGLRLLMLALLRDTGADAEVFSYEVIPLSDYLSLARGGHGLLALALVLLAAAEKIPVGVLLPFLFPRMRSYWKTTLVSWFVIMNAVELINLVMKGNLQIDFGFSLPLFAGVSTGYWIWNRLIFRVNTAPKADYLA